jgi:hypothetical protein
MSDGSPRAKNIGRNSWRAAPDSPQSRDPAIKLLAKIAAARDGSFPGHGAMKTDEYDPEFILRAAREELLSLQDSREALCRECASAGRGGPYSVTFKRRVAPSGCRHDFLSVGPYWWPDPDSPDGSPYIRKDGKVNPEVLQLDGHAIRNMADDVTRLLLAGQLLEKQDAFDRAALLLRTWFLDGETRMNPHLQFGQAVTGICSGRGIGLIDTASLCGLLWQLSVFPNFPGWTAHDQAGLKRWFADYLDWMLTSSLGQDESREHNNHGTWYDAQVCAYASFIGDTALIRRQLEHLTCGRVMAQIAGDGSMPHEWARTLPVHYSFFNLQGFIICALHGREAGLDLFQCDGGIGPRLTSAAEWFCRDVLPGCGEISSQLRPFRKDLTFWALVRLAALAGEGAWTGVVNSECRFAWQKILYRHMRTDEYLVSGRPVP